MAKYYFLERLSPQRKMSWLLEECLDLDLGCITPYCKVMYPFSVFAKGDFMWCKWKLGFLRKLSESSVWHRNCMKTHTLAYLTTPVAVFTVP